MSSIGTDFSAAVAARSAGCSYAFGEILVYGSMLSGSVSVTTLSSESLLATGPQSEP